MGTSRILRRILTVLSLKLSAQQCSTEDPQIAKSYHTSGNPIQPSNFQDRKIYLKLHSSGDFSDDPLCIFEYDGLLKELNALFAPMNLEFYFYNDCIENHPDMSFDELMQFNSLDKIDVFIKSGLSAYLGSFSVSSILVGINIPPGLWAHEIGHVLQLYHTHRYEGIYENGICVGFRHECPDGESDHGDYVEDTKGDPLYTFSGETTHSGACLIDSRKYFDGCEVKPSIFNYHVDRCTDSNGNPRTNTWDPPVDNIMSYHCETNFTDGQYKRMDAALSQEAHLLQLNMNATPNPNLQYGGNVITDDIIITDHRVYTDEVLELGPGVKIIVQPSGSLTLNNSTIKRAVNNDPCCGPVKSARWDGIYYNSSNELVIENNSSVAGSMNGIVVDCSNNLPIPWPIPAVQIWVKNSYLGDHSASTLRENNCSNSDGLKTILWILNSELEILNTAGYTSLAISLEYGNVEVLNSQITIEDVADRPVISQFKGQCNVRNSNIDISVTRRSWRFADIFTGVVDWGQQWTIVDFSNNTVKSNGAPANLFRLENGGAVSFGMDENMCTGNIGRAVGSYSIGWYSIQNNDFSNGKIDLSNARFAYVRNNGLNNVAISNWSKWVFVECNEMRYPLEAIFALVSPTLPESWGNMVESAGNYKANANDVPLMELRPLNDFEYYKTDEDIEKYNFTFLQPTFAPELNCGSAGPGLPDGEGNTEFNNSDAWLTYSNLKDNLSSLENKRSELIDAGNTEGLITQINQAETETELAHLMQELNSISPFVSEQAYEALMLKKVYPSSN